MEDARLLLIKAGFVLVSKSYQSESEYWKRPERIGLLRLSCHRRHAVKNNRDCVQVSQTFSDNMKRSLSER